MKIGYVVIGLVLLVIGIIMVLLLWPMVGFETKDTFEMDEIKGGETVRYVGEITEKTKFGDVYVLELDNGVLEVYTDDEEFNINERVLVIIEYGDDTANWDENTYSVKKVPTIEGLIGLIMGILGIVVLVLGIIAKKTKIEDLFPVKTRRAILSRPSQSTASVRNEAHFSDFTTTTPAPLGSPQSPQVEQYRCPQCNNVFGIKSSTKPLKISCPKCGLEGVRN